MQQTVTRWGVFEFSASGKTDGNPFTDYSISGVFTCAQQTVKVDGFYDGDGVYRVRFTPAFTGHYDYTISGSALKTELGSEVYSGSFEALPPEEGSHGMVRPCLKYHFAYDDGTPYLPIGTTCYAWTHQSEKMQELTLETLEASPFNKLRFCIFPKHYDYNLYEPQSYPFEGTPRDISGLTSENFESYLPTDPENSWDFARFNPEHFRNIEKRIQQLGKLGVQADIILFHPYDRWGFSCMTPEQDEFYIKYVLARFSAFSNVWWSLANEYDLFKSKTIADWERIADVICRFDPYNHLRSIHNCFSRYDFTRPWITHCSIQRNEIYASAADTKRWREQYQKPVVLDEAGYEGDINWSWGNLTAQELTRLFWTAAVRGGYCGHGETYTGHGALWWSHGGRLYGQSCARIAFLCGIMKEAPGGYLEPANVRRWEDNAATSAHPGYRNKYYLFYTGRTRPSFREFEFEKGHTYKAEVIDTWDMTIEDRGEFCGKFRLELPAKEYIAVRITDKTLLAEE